MLAAEKCQENDYFSLWRLQCSYALMPQARSAGGRRAERATVSARTRKEAEHVLVEARA
jgi:hypothetical protein